MSSRITKISLKILKWLGVFIGSILLLMFLIPLLFPGQVAQQVKALANKSLAGELEFKESKLSFFTHFPSLTVSLDELSLLGSQPFANDTLLRADQVAFGINLKRLIFDGEVKIDELYVSDAFINVMVNEKGEANYNVYVAPEDQPKDTLNEQGTAIKLDRIEFENCHVKYADRSAKILVDAHGFNYIGKGGFSEAVFDLETDAEIDSVDFIYDNVAYLEKKRLRADLITRINTSSLSFILQKNELRVNKLPVEFTGEFTILRDGYNINLDAKSEDNRLADLFSVLPPQYLTWLEDTRIRGRSDLNITFKGRYKAATNQQPDLGVSMKVRDGLIEYDGAPVPLSNLKLDLSAKLPALDVEQLQVNLKALDFQVGDNDKFHAFLQSRGMSKMQLKANVKGTLNLATLDQAIGLKDFDLKGNLKTDIEAQGIYDAEKRLFPKTKGGINLQNGWLKTKYYPNPITNIKFVASASNPAGTFEALKVAITPASFVFEGNPIFVNAVFSDFDDTYYDLRAKGELNVGRIYKVFAQKGLDVEGYAKADFALKGRESYATTGQYEKLDNKGNIILKNIKTASELFPKAFLIREGYFSFHQEKMFFDKFKANYGKSDFAINGHLINTINYFLESNGTLHGTFNLKSQLINVDEFMALEEGENTDRKAAVVVAKEANPRQSGVVVLPTNLDVSLVANANKVEYTGLILNKLIGKVGVRNGRVSLENTTFNIIDCQVGIDASYDDESPTAAKFDAHLRAKDFDVKRAYNEIPLFREMVTAAEKAEGVISLDYKIKGDFDGNMSPIMESLEGGGIISVRDVKVAGLKLFGGISSKTRQKSLNDPNIKGIDIKTTINDNLIHIDDFTFKIAGFRPKIKGTTSFDGLLDIRVRLGLPPLGIIGIPIVVTGTHEDPKIKVFSKTGQEIEGSEYNEKTNTVIKKSSVKKE
ncbi:MAG: AsmA-like C-terminal region-containing protein [Flavobacterium sp.]